MSLLSVADNIIVVAKGLQIFIIDESSRIISAHQTSKIHEDCIVDVEISPDKKYIAALTSSSKQLYIYKLPNAENLSSFVLPRSASKIRFTGDSKHILVADKSGDALMYDLNKADGISSKLLGHLSLLLNILQTKDRRFIITSDRDEKIRVTCYPNTYNIHTFCLGHKEFVNHIEMLPHDERFLTSASGDGTIKIWNYSSGILNYTIDTNIDIGDKDLLPKFKKAMDEDGIEVNSLPIVHYTVTKVNNLCSLIFASIYSYNSLLIYSLCIKDDKFIHKLEDKLQLEEFPDNIKCHESLLYTLNNNVCNVYKIKQENDKVKMEFDKKVTLNYELNGTCVKSQDSIKILYKRKFDNVQEYQERKRKRLEKCSE